MRTPCPIVGGAIGDALGAPFETLKESDPRLISWKGGYLPTKGGYHDLEEGQWTDDTQMQIALSGCLKEAGKYDPEVAARHYVAWYLSGKARGIGGTTREAMERLVAGVHWSKAGVRGAVGNAPPMRAAPLGAFYKDPGVAAQMARLDATITHFNREVEEAAAAMAMAVSFLAQGHPKEKLAGFLSGGLADSLVRERIARTPAGWKIAKETYAADARAWSIVPFAVACFVHTSSFEEAVMAAIRAGGDTDTAASMTGVMAGAYYGIEGIPSDLILGLEDAGLLREIETSVLKLG